MWSIAVQCCRCRYTNLCCICNWIVTVNEDSLPFWYIAVISLYFNQPYLPHTPGLGQLANRPQHVMPVTKQKYLNDITGFGEHKWNDLEQVSRSEIKQIVFHHQELFMSMRWNFFWHSEAILATHCTWCHTSL